MSYSLSIMISNSDLQQIYASNKSVILVKTVASALSETPTAWVAFRPMTNNQVSWGTAYQAFASNTQIINGIMIYPTSQADVGFGQAIEYSSGGFGTPESNAAPSTAMEVINLMKGQTMTTGLSQASNVNGMQQSATPICALSLMSAMSVTLTPIETVSIFLASNTMQGAVMCNLPSNACAVSFSNGSSSCTVQYSSASESFIAQ